MEAPRRALEPPPEAAGDRPPSTFVAVDPGEEAETDVGLGNRHAELDTGVGPIARNPAVVAPGSQHRELVSDTDTT